MSLAPGIRMTLPPTAATLLRLRPPAITTSPADTVREPLYSPPVISTFPALLVPLLLPPVIRTDAPTEVESALDIAPAIIETLPAEAVVVLELTTPPDIVTPPAVPTPEPPPRVIDEPPIVPPPTAVVKPAVKINVPPLPAVVPLLVPFDATSWKRLPVTKVADASPAAVPVCINMPPRRRVCNGPLNVVHSEVAPAPRISICPFPPLAPA